jgi:predicted PurR-regulated permease PerM
MAEATENTGTTASPLQGASPLPAAAKAPKPPLSYTQKVMIAVGTTAAAVLLAILVYFTAEILVLCFAGLLFAVFLSAPTDLLSKYAKIKRIYALAIVLVSFAALVLGTGYFMGYTITKQTQEMSRTMSGAIHQFGADLQRRFIPAPPPATTPGAATTGPETLAATAATEPATRSAGSDQWIAEELAKVRQAASDFFFSESFVKRAGGVAGGVVSSTFGIIGNIAVVLGVGLFFAINPRLYMQGVVKLVPLAHRPRVAEILSEVGTQLEWWFVGQLCSMFSIALLTYIGLTILGIPMAITLAILAGLLNFIPNFGPLLAAAPAVLIAFAPQGTQTTLNPALAGWVILMYVVIQLLEGWVITPFFQARAVELPPALIIVSQVVFALLLGPLGLILATPILAATLVLVRMLYVEDVLGDREGGRDKVTK